MYMGITILLKYKNLDRYRSENNFVEHLNNYVGLKHDEQTFCSNGKKFFDILAIS